jgi:hypothetical protein
MSSLLTFPIKTTSPLNFGPQIKEYIQNTYKAEWDPYIPDANTLNAYRRDIESGETGMTGIEKLERYQQSNIEGQKDLVNGSD